MWLLSRHHQIHSFARSQLNKRSEADLKPLPSLQATLLLFYIRTSSLHICLLCSSSHEKPICWLSLNVVTQAPACVFRCHQVLASLVDQLLHSESSGAVDAPQVMGQVDVYLAWQAVRQAYGVLPDCAATLKEVCSTSQFVCDVMQDAGGRYFLHVVNDTVNCLLVKELW